MDFIKNLGDKEAQAFIENNKELVILDVRRYNEFKTQLEDYKDKPILVYCRAGHRSVVACNILNDAGFEKLYNLSYGTLGYTGRLEPI
ncbi:rhodanese-like domain-containing protein [Clostridium sp.]|uniref:rhodanese-like domain-containing protein n=1 Tax=Clostridium sp. TaxID=1506 RepID=UPI002907DBF9|nr:rhodanese-like domain-containing protein [Clostridium sp.]MDU3354258.1 rhodanese-like domain-containing protein [Clostridium sp.]